VYPHHASMTVFAKLSMKLFKFASASLHFKAHFVSKHSIRVALKIVRMAEIATRSVTKDFANVCPAIRASCVKNMCNSTCVNLQDDYKCICDEGLIGKRCHLKPCDYSPCPQNSVCVNLKFLQATRESYT
jgi:EGF-like domain